MCVCRDLVTHDDRRMEEKEGSVVGTLGVKFLGWIVECGVMMGLF